MALKVGVAVQTACVAIASRLVAASFRMVESLNPQLQQRRVITEPKVVFIREAVTLGVAWIFALGTNLALAPYAARKKWNPQMVTFVTALVGTFFAELLGRVVAYRQKSQSPPKSVETPRMASPAPSLPVAKPPEQPAIETPVQPYWSGYSSQAGGYPYSGAYSGYAYFPYNYGWPTYSLYY